MLAAYREYGMSAAIWDYQAEAGLHAMRLILSGTLDRNPGLTIVLGHLGEGLPYWLRRIDNRHAFAQRVAGTAAPMPRLDLTPSEYFRGTSPSPPAASTLTGAQRASISHRTAERVFALQ